MRLEVVQQFLGHASPETTRKACAMTWEEVMDYQVATYRPALSEAAERAHGKVKKHETRKKAPRGLRQACQMGVHEDRHRNRGNPRNGAKSEPNDKLCKHTVESRGNFPFLAEIEVHCSVLHWKG